MTRSKYQEITEALKILELPERATLEKIKSNYRRLLSRWHPDKIHPKGPAMARIKLKRVYEDTDPSDGCRILVDRVWPRGVPRKKTC